MSASGLVLVLMLGDTDNFYCLNAPIHSSRAGNRLVTTKGGIHALELEIGLYS